MGQIVTIAIILVSLAGIVFILWRKIPLLLEVQAEREVRMREYLTGHAKELVSSAKIKSVASKNLDRTLSKAKGIASKTEAQTGEVVGRLKKRSKERKQEFSESYSEQLNKKSDE